MEILRIILVIVGGALVGLFLGEALGYLASKQYAEAEKRRRKS